MREEDLPAAAVGSILVLSPVRAVATEHMQLILTFLRSPAVGKLATGATGRRRLHSATLASLNLPQPDDELSAALHDLELSRSRMKTWADDAAYLTRTALDDGVISSKKRQSIIDAAAVLRLRCEAAAAVDTAK
ncbi:hypothetical protein [Umezawaea beigongshangensis]|uniref:hypothetical protein n=1 Tax=Umezawaea beigongshangensis TaxID=2780383 RepID=UPI0018F26756|nr:hypothetical protein [Umezawaea beigongshangensis]